MKRMSMRIREKMAGKDKDIEEIALVEKDKAKGPDSTQSPGMSSTKKKSQSAMQKPIELKVPNIEVVDYLPQSSGDDKNGESFGNDEEIPQLRRSARKTSVAGAGSCSMNKGKKLFQPNKDVKVLGESKIATTPSKMKKESLSLLSKDELDGSFKLPKKVNSPMMKPKGTPKKKNGGKENSATAPEIDPMIFEGNFPILKLHRIDESLPSPLTGVLTYKAVLPSGNQSEEDEQQDKWLMWNGDDYSNYSSAEEGPIQEIIDSLDSPIEEGKENLPA